MSVDQPRPKRLEIRPDRATVPQLLAVNARVRGISYEPALGPVDWRNYLTQCCGNPIEGTPGSFVTPPDPPTCCGDRQAGIDWIIVGGESDQGSAKGRTFDLAWARSTVDLCRQAGTAPFVKQLGSTPIEMLGAGAIGHWEWKDRAGADLSEWPEELRVQEFPI